MRKEGLLREDMGRYADAIRWYSRGLRRPSSPRRARADARRRSSSSIASAQARFRQGAFARLHPPLRRRSSGGAAMPTTGRPRAGVRASAPRRTRMLGSPDRAAFRGLALPLHEELGDLNAQATDLNNLGIDAYYEGDWTKALDLYERSRGLHERIGDVTHTAHDVDQHRRDPLRPGPLLEEAEELFGQVVRDSPTRSDTGSSRRSRGPTSAARPRASGASTTRASLLDGALASRARDGADGFAPEVDLRLAELEALRGDSPAGAARADRRAGPSATRGAGRRRAAPRLRPPRPRGRAAPARPPRRGDRAESRRASRSRAPATCRSSSRSRSTSRRARAIAAAAAESAALFGRLGVERVARPPLPGF